jgi:hypothetical protein
MKEYRLWQLILYPSLQLLTGFVLSRRYGWAWDTGFILISLCFLSVMTGAYMLLYTLEQVLKVQAWDATTPPKQEPTKVPNLGGLQMTTLSVKYDTERMFCKALLEFPNLTEAYWLKGNPSKWQSMGGVGRRDFVMCKDRLTKIGALARTNPQAGNSPHKVADRRILEHRASHPTPPT